MANQVRRDYRCLERVAVGTRAAMGRELGRCGARGRWWVEGGDRAGAGAGRRTAPRAVVSLGMGADSSALVAAWDGGILPLPCPWQDMAVLIAQTGDEWPVTQQLVEELFPLLAPRRVRYLRWQHISELTFANA